MADYTAINNPELYFQTKAYTGNGTAIGSGGNSITFDGDNNMRPDWLWVKCRSDANGGQIFDVLRTTNSISPNATDAEADRASDGFTSLDSDGFTMNGSSNTNGTINTTVSANTTAGFSIVTYASNGSSSQTVGHGLGVVPNMIISKNRTNGTSTYGKWIVYSSFLPTANDKKLLLNETATASSTNEWGDADPTTSVYSVHTSGDGSTNHTSDKIIAYCFANVQGFSKCATYVGNGNADGTFVYCGFRPAWVMIKNTSSSNDWIIFDIKRDTLAPNNPVGRKSLEANDSAAEVTRTTKDMDYLSNGFKIRTSDGTQNTSGETYFFMAFAESPFVNSNGIPNNGA